MARRVTINSKQRARASRKAASRARRQTASDRRLDVKIPRRQANRAFQSEKRSYQAAGNYATNSLSQALKGTSKLGLGRYERDVRDEFKAMRADVPLGVHAGVTAARQTRNDELADIAMTSRALRADQADLEHDIRRDLISKTKERKRERLATERKRAKKRKERAREQRIDQNKQSREFDRDVKKAMHEVRSLIQSKAIARVNAGLPEGKKISELSPADARKATKQVKQEMRANPKLKQMIANELVASQDTRRKVADQALTNFMRGPKARKFSQKSGGSAQKAARIHERRMKRQRPYDPLRGRAG